MKLSGEVLQYIIKKLQKLSASISGMYWTLKHTILSVDLNEWAVFQGYNFYYTPYFLPLRYLTEIIIKMVWKQLQSNEIAFLLQ